MATLDYDFKLLNPSQYSLEITLPIKGELMNKVFAQSRAALQKKGVSVNQDLSAADDFEIPGRYRSLIKTALRSQIRKIFKLVKKDKIHVLNDNVHSCVFRRTESDSWDVVIVLQGQFADKR